MKDFEQMQRRFAVENEQEWREKQDDLPYLQFPADWHVKIIPPFGGAYARFLVSKTGAPKPWVSVYLDMDDTLGAVGEPYWELYPNKDKDCDRFLMSETKELIAGIEEALKWLEKPNAP